MTTCAKPVAFEALAAFFTGDLAPDEAAAVEEHLFACDECAAACDRLGKLVAGLREIIPPIISHAHRARMERAGRRIHSTMVPSNVETHAYFKRDLDLLVHVLKGDLSSAARVDVEVVKPDGEVALRMEQVPFEATAGEVLIACQRHYQGMYPGGDPTFRVVAVDGDQRREVGRYLVVHHWE